MTRKIYLLLLLSIICTFFGATAFAQRAGSGADQIASFADDLGWFPTEGEILGLPVNTSLFRPSASAVIYGQHDADGIRFENIDKALSVPESDLRLFGKPTSFKRRRMGVALASADNVSEARARAQKASSLVKTSV